MVQTNVHAAMSGLMAALVSASLAAAEAPRPSKPATSSIPDAEPVKCYRMAWESREKGGLGLTAGQAVRLCSGATDALKVVLCYAQAWEHPANGGLGLTAGQAVTLCRTASVDAVE
jgi:hypothetical protein